MAVVTSSGTWGKKHTVRSWKMPIIWTHTDAIAVGLFSKGI